MAEKYKVGNQLIVMLNDGRIVEAKIRAVIANHLQNVVIPGLNPRT